MASGNTTCGPDRCGDGECRREYAYAYFQVHYQAPVSRDGNGALPILRTIYF
jgi:hypothetical protein